MNRRFNDIVLRTLVGVEPPLPNRPENHPPFAVGLFRPDFSLSDSSKSSTVANTRSTDDLSVVEEDRKPISRFFTRFLVRKS